MELHATNSPTDDEAEMAQVQALHINDNAIAAHRAKLEAEAKREAAMECVECGEEIPEARRLAVPGVQLCIYCKEVSERPV